MHSCAMDTRFNSFYREGHHPFVEAMGSFLVESGMRARRTEFATSYLYRAATQKYWEDVKLMRDVADHVVATRRGHPSGKKDLVDAMLNGIYPRTGKCLSDSSITDNMITFLIAGKSSPSRTFDILLISKRTRNNIWLAFICLLPAA